MTRSSRLQAIRRRIRYCDYLAELPDPASLARSPTREEHDQIARASDLVGAQAGAAWVARRRGLR